MPLSTSRSYFITRSSVQLKKNPGGGSSVNHLLLGDWLRYLGDTQGDWARIRCRGDVGWIRTGDFSEARALEVNFIDIGQGDGCHIVTPDDEVILIDSGVGTNMNRFLSWRYNLRSRNVRRAPDFDPERAERAPWPIDHVVITHPDNDHYYGFLDVFSNPKLSFDRIWHNGIVERPILEDDPSLWYPSRDDLGGYVRGGTSYLWDVAHTPERLREIVDAHPTSQKQLLRTLRACFANSPDATFQAVSRRDDALTVPTHLGPFDGSTSVTLEVLGPITEEVDHNGESRRCLRRLGDEGVTKNGHSVILKLVFGRLKVLLGGDLNTEAQDFLLRQYTSVSTKASTLEDRIAAYEALGDTITDDDRDRLERDRAKRAAQVEEARSVFECDVAKACHHGSAHFVDTFLRAVNPVVTVISSGDEESHSHPRPDALGTFGKHGRGRRPLIFSTELARSTREFTPILRYLEELRRYEAALAAEPDPREREAIRTAMEGRRDRNVAVYGMITLRALGDVILLAQKLEVPASRGSTLQKWDIYELHHNEHTGTFEYTGH